MAKKDPNSEPADSVYRDPFTGTTPVGPVQSETPGAAAPKDRWSMAAKWFLIALVVLGLLFVVGYFIR